MEWIILFSLVLQADRGFARSQLCSNEDGTTNNLVLYTVYGMVHQKRGGMLRGLQIKRKREEYVGCLFLHKPHYNKILATVAAIFTRLSIKRHN